MDAFIIIFTAVVIASSNSLLGSFLVLRKNVMIGDAISHAILPGLIIGFLVSGSLHSFPMLIAAAVSGLLCTVLIQTFSKSGKLPKDASIGFTFTFLFAIGIILVTLYAEDIDIDADCVLHGELGFISLEPPITFLGLEIFPQTTWNSIFVLGIVILTIVVFFKEFLITSFDPLFARTIGLKTGFWDYLIMGITSITTVVSFEAVGAILVVAFMVIPSASAYLLTKKLKSMLLLSVILGAIGSVTGYFFSAWFNTSISAAIVCSMSLIFIISFIFVLIPKRIISHERSQH